MRKEDKAKKVEAAANKGKAVNRIKSVRVPKFANAQRNERERLKASDALCLSCSILRGNFSGDIHINFPNRMIFRINGRSKIVVIPIWLLKRQLP